MQSLYCKYTSWMFFIQHNLSCFSLFFTCLVKRQLVGRKQCLWSVKCFYAPYGCAQSFAQVCTVHICFHRILPTPPPTLPSSSCSLKHIKKQLFSTAVLKAAENHLADNPTGAQTVLRRIIIIIRVMTPLLSSLSHAYYSTAFFCQFCSISANNFFESLCLVQL